MLWTALLVTLFVIGFLGASILLLRLLFPAPSPTRNPASQALSPAQKGPLAEAHRALAECNTGQSGIAPLEDGMAAFVARMLLAGSAVSSLDVQYYIWRADMTGYLLLKALQSAAERGVRVRLLLDDNGINDLDTVLADLDSHPNIEIRLFNPFVLRRFKRLSYGFDFFRLNHRMHNKSFTVDGRASILGGRNVGDEYFGAGRNPLQIDLDVLAIGEIVPEISAEFDRYWNAASVHEAARFLRKGARQLPLASRLEAFEADPMFTTYRALLDASDVVSSLAKGTLALEWTNATLISDDPAKVFRPVKDKDLFVTRLREAVGPIKRRFDGVTPYFVPGDAGVKALSELTDRGVAVRMLTNSLEATNMLPVHAGYSKRRKDLLAADIDLFELRARAAGPSERDRLGPLGSSGSNLHAKTFAVDGNRIFVGSFNFDPRSATLNTEMGLIIESERMAGALHRSFDLGLGGLAWQVELRDRKLIWVDATDRSTMLHEPGTTFSRRVALRVIGWLPVEWLL